MKKFILILLAIAAILGAVVLYFGNFMLEVAVHPQSDTRYQLDSCLVAVYNKYPELELWRDTLIQKGNWRDTMLVAEDGTLRHGVVMHHDSLSNGSTVILHGYNDNTVRMMRYAYLHYEMLGRDVIVPDHFGHGLSGGDHIRFAWLDHYDICQLWIPLAHQLWPEDQMVVHGLSMGGAMTMYTSGEQFDDSLRLVGFIEDCGYSGIWEQLEYQLKQEYGMPAFPLLYVANWLCGVKYGWTFRDGDALKQVAKCQKPMLFIHGDADDYVPTWMGMKAYETKQGTKELWIVPGAKHARSIHNNWEEYCQRCEEFIDRIQD